MLDSLYGCQIAGEERAALLRAWEQAPGARHAHPREEHLLPLMVAAGAAADEGAQAVTEGLLFNCKYASFVFGGVNSNGATA